MKFQLNINLNDNDYLEYNDFWLFRSHYGKKQIIGLRLFAVALVAVIFLISLFGGGFSLETLIGKIPMVIVLILFQITLKPIFILYLKTHFKNLKKKGKMGYSPSSCMEFYDDVFVEITPDNKTEQKYSSIERISIVGNKTIYIHINNIAAYILPFRCFESKEQIDSFLEFIKSKCANIDVY